MGHAARQSSSHRILTDEGKATAVRRFLAGQTPAGVGLTLNVSALTVEDALREALTGLSRLATVSCDTGPRP